MVLFECQGNVDGILTGIYDAWASGLGHGNVGLRIPETGTMELFAKYRSVAPDSEKAEKVARTIRRRMGERAWQTLYQAALSSRRDRADRIYRVLVLALAPGIGADMAGRILDRLQDPDVAAVFEMSRNVGNEAHRYLGFVRFQELSGGILFSRIRPENQILPLLGDHFSNRFPRENFVIFDTGRRDALLHRAGGPWAVFEKAEMEELQPGRFSAGEEAFRKLWKGFCQSISISERENPRLQKQLWPLKYRKWMTEGEDFLSNHRTSSP